MRPRRLRPFLAAAFALALLTSAIFGLMALWSIWAFSARAERPVAGWMTPRYVVAVYGVDPAALTKVLHLPPGSDPRESIATLAYATGRAPQDVLAEIDALVAEAQSDRAQDAE